MKISQEVRDFAASEAQRGAAVRGTDAVSGSGRAAKQNAEADAFIAAEEAEAGMKQMSEVFRETGGELYMGAGGREHD